MASSTTSQDKKGQKTPVAPQTEAPKRIQTETVLKWTGLVAFAVIVLASLPGNTFRILPEYNLLEPWRHDDLTADLTFPILKSAQEIETEESLTRRQTPPVFIQNTEPELLRDELEGRWMERLSAIEQVLEQRANPEDNRSSVQAQDGDQSENAEQAQAALDEQAQASLPFGLDESQWAELQQTLGTQASLPALQRTLAPLEQALMKAQTAIILDRELPQIETLEVMVRNTAQRTERTLNKSVANDTQTATIQAVAVAHESLPTIPRATLNALADGLLQPTAFYSDAESQRRLDNALSKLSNTKGAIAQGQIIIRRGDIVTEERAAHLESYVAARSAEVTQIERWTRMAGEMILVIGINLILMVYLRLYRPDIFGQWRTLYPVLIVLALMTAITRVSYSVDSFQAEMVPLAIAPIVLTILFDQRLGMLAILTLASTTALIQDSSYEFYLATMMAGSAGVFSVKQIQKRTHFFFTTPAAVLGGYVLVYGGLAISQLQPLDVAVGRVIPLLINAALILFAWPLLLLFEKGFSITTDLALQELSDTNHPLMKKLMNEAPGTFHHSLQVSNLAENAANAIGANGMLCRVGGYFHDIGKTDRPQFFVENQTEGNRHDVLNPIMSQKIIREHVSKGVEMGREAGLPTPILDIIQTHHGTSLIRFFFDKAQKTTDRKKEVGAIEEEDYRYDGPLPTTKEEGILMLADGVEAASRAVKPADEKKLDALIGQLIEIPLEDGQLDQCPLTIPEINAVRESFFKTLKGVYHQRIEYPEEKEKASSETNTVPSQNSNPS